MLIMYHQTFISVNTIIIIILLLDKKFFCIHSINMSNPTQNKHGQNPPQNELEKITEIQNLLQNGIEEITRTQNLAKDEKTR